MDNLKLEFDNCIVERLIYAVKEYNCELDLDMLKEYKNSPFKIIKTAQNRPDIESNTYDITVTIQSEFYTDFVIGFVYHPPIDPEDTDFDFMYENIYIIHDELLHDYKFIPYFNNS